MADIVLPATTFLEHDDFYKAGGHSYLQIAPKVIEPYAQARSNHEVICALAERLGADHAGFRMSAWELIDATLEASGLPDAETLKARRWHDCQPDFETSHFLNGFGTPDSRFRFAPDWGSIEVIGGGPSLSAEIMPKLPDHMAVIEESDEEHPIPLDHAAVARLSQFELYSDPHVGRTSRAADGFCSPCESRTARHCRRCDCDNRQPSRRGIATRPLVRWNATGRVGGRRSLAQCDLRGRRGDQCVDRR